KKTQNRGGQNRAAGSGFYRPIHAGFVSKFVPSEYIDFRKPFLQTLFDIRDRGALADSQHDVHGIVRPETEIPDGIAIGSEQKRNAKERAITLDLPLDPGAVTIDLNFCWQCRDGNQVPIARIVKNRVRGYLSGQLGQIGNYFQAGCPMRSAPASSAARGLEK